METQKDLQGIFKILVATDIHLGHNQKHPIQGDDSFNAFDEILEIAKLKDVDILLLGGDLFDQINPSQSTIYRCLNSLRSNIFGGKEIEMVATGIQPNYTNENLNISLPVFTIHGNHDFPQEGNGLISVCDLLAASNYVNYIGKYSNTDEILVRPIILRKGIHRIAIYGLGYINSFKIQRLFTDNKIRFVDPPADCFKLMILHQNRFKGKALGADYNKCVHASQLPQWMDLVIWCHQHESKPIIEVESGINIYQPGSTIATSLIQAEAAKKHVGLLKIAGDNFDFQPIFLQKSHRELIFRNLELRQLEKEYPNKLQQFDPNKILLTEFKKILDQHKQKLNGKKPLVRMKVECSGFEISKLKDLEMEVSEHVANTSEVFKIWRRVEPKPRDIPSDDEFMKAFKNKQPLEADQKQIEFGILDKFKNELDKAGYKSIVLPKQGIINCIENIIKKRQYNPDTLNDFMQQHEKRCISLVKKQLTGFHANLQQRYANTFNYYKNQIKENMKGEGRQLDPPSNLLYSDDYQLAHKLKDQQIKQSFIQKLTELKSQSQQMIPDSKQGILIDELEQCCPVKNQKFNYITSQNFEMMQNMVQNDVKKDNRKKKISRKQKDK